ADFTLIGRAYLYGLMAGGRKGVDRAIAILQDQIERTMKLLQVTDVAELTPAHVTQLQRLVPRATRAQSARAGAASVLRWLLVPRRVGVPPGAFPAVEFGDRGEVVVVEAHLGGLEVLGDPGGGDGLG